MFVPLIWIELLALTHLSGRFDFGLATIGTLAVWALVPLYPMIRFRSGERSLQARPDGVSVSIDGKTRFKPWKRFTRLEEDADHLFLFGGRYNAFIIAKQSFASPAEIDEFSAGVRALIPARSR